MLKNILKKLTPVAILFILFASFTAEIPQDNTSDSNYSIELCHDLDEPIEKE